MSSASRPLSYDDFLEYLTHAELQSAYEEDCKIAIRKARRRFEAEKTKSIENLRRGLNKDNQHRRVLNACLYPFAKGEISGYHFIRAAPLAELQPPVENLDFLIVCSDPLPGECKIAIFGESKGPTDDPDGVVTETKGKISVLEAHQSEIKERYIGEELGREFVLGVLASDTNEVAKSVVRKGGGIVVWSIDFSNEPILSLHRPDLGKSEKDKEVRATMFHNNQRLNQALYKLATSDEFKSFYVQSHRVTKLKILTAVDKGREDRTFGLDDVKALVREALDYLDEETINQESRGILESAIKISFVREVSPGRYKIKSRSKNAGIRADDIVRLWIEHKLHEERRQLIDAELLLLQELFRGKKAAIPSLEGFDIWDNSKVGTSSAN